jgi:hypothetical protein
MQVSRAAKHGLRRPGPFETKVYFLVLPGFAAPDFDLAGSLNAVPVVFFLSAFGFLGSRLLLF